MKTTRTDFPRGRRRVHIVLRPKDPAYAPTLPVGSSAHFRGEVATVVARLQRHLLEIRDEHTLPAIAAGMVTQTVSILSACVAQHHMSREQARQLTVRLANLEFAAEDVTQKPSEA